MEDVGGGGGGGPSSWGSITGTISNQTDLQSALNGKSATTHNHDASYQPVDPDLTALAALTSTGGWAKRTASNTWIISTPTAADVGADSSGTAASAVSTHVGLSDPHTQYQRETERNAANGYAGLDGSSKLTGSQQVYGSAANMACQGNDSRLSDARTPTSHSSTHSSGGPDAITITNLGGFPGGTTNFLRADGTFATPAGGGGNVVPVRTTADRTTTSATMGTVTDLVIPIAANEVWHVDVYLRAGCNNIGGAQFSLLAPAGATVEAVASGNTTAATAFTVGAITASDGASPTFLAVSAQNRLVEIHGVVANGATAGNISVRFKSVTATQTTTVSRNSRMVGTKQ